MRESMSVQVLAASVALQRVVLSRQESFSECRNHTEL